MRHRLKQWMDTRWDQLPGTLIAASVAAAVLLASVLPGAAFGVYVEPPTAVPDSFSTDEDVTLRVGAPGVLVNDDDPAASTIHALLVEGVQHGKMIFREDGSFDYQPDPGWSGIDGFTYQASNGDLLSPETVVDIEVRPFPDLPRIERISVSSAGLEGDAESGSEIAYDSSVSADGRFVAFSSLASNLVEGDANGVIDVFVRDRVLGTTSIVSVSSAETLGGGQSFDPSISADGRYIAFTSEASNLVAGDNNGKADVFLRDTIAGTTMRVSIADDETESGDRSGLPSVSADGRYVAFSSAAADLVPGDDNGHEDVFVRDVSLGTTTLVSVGVGGEGGTGVSAHPAISADGRYVAFHSNAANLVDPDQNGGTYDVFRTDLLTGVTIVVSVDSSGNQASAGRSFDPTISADGRYVAFYSEASELVTGDTNGMEDVFLRDISLGVTSRLSVSSDGVQGDSSSLHPTISADGRYVCFASLASNLVAGDTGMQSDVFRRDTHANTTTRLTHDLDGKSAERGGGAPAISADGRYASFVSFSSDLVPDDTNGAADTFIAGPPPDDVHSFVGADRYQTAILVSQKAYPLGADTVFLVKGDNFPDALAAAPLAFAYDGPIVITPSSGMTAAVKEELSRLSPHTVFFIGLPESVKAGIAEALPGIEDVGPGVEQGIVTIRGIDRYHTAALLAVELQKKLEEGGGTVNAVALVAGDKFPDALSVAPLAAVNGWAVLLTPQAGPLPPVTEEMFATLGVTQSLTVGTRVVPPVPEGGRTSIVGIDRYDTCARVAAYAETRGLSFDHIGVAKGDNYPDALVVGPYLARYGGLVLLTPSTGLAASIRQTLELHRDVVHHVDFPGLPQVVIDDVIRILR